MTRSRLPPRRQSTTLDLWYKGERFHVSYARDPDGRISEVFLHGPKVGSDLDGMAFDIGVALSLALQHGADVDVLGHSVARLEDGHPASIVGAVLDMLRPLDHMSLETEYAYFNAKETT